MNMIEKVARGINQHFIEQTNESWSRYRRDDSWKQHISVAKAAILAMHEPSEGMNAVGDSYMIMSGSSKIVWRLMIDEALKER